MILSTADTVSIRVTSLGVGPSNAPSNGESGAMFGLGMSAVTQEAWMHGTPYIGSGEAFILFFLCERQCDLFRITLHEIARGKDVLQFGFPPLPPLQHLLLDLFLCLCRVTFRYPCLSKTLDFIVGRRRVRRSHCLMTGVLLVMAQSAY